MEKVSKASNMKHFISYSLIGVVGATLDFVLFLLLLRIGIYYQFANFFSTCAGIFNNFFLNSYFNFKKTDKLLLRLASFFSVGLLGLAVTTLLLAFFVGVLDLNAGFVKFFSIGVITVVQFTLNKHITFRNRKKVPQGIPRGHVAIIGGGFTGLVAAYELSKYEHIQVTLFEGGKEVGGLAASTKIENESIEAAYHHTFMGDKELKRLLIELGIEKQMQWLPSSVGLYVGGTMYSFMGAIDLLRFKALPFFDRLRTGVISVMLQMLPWWECLTTQKAYTWVYRWYGKRASQVIWGPLLQAKFSTYYKDISMAWLWARLHSRGASRKNIFSKELLGYPKGGYQVIVAVIVEELQRRGVNILTNAQITSVDNTSVEYGGISTSFDKILFTTSSKVASQLIKPSVISKEYRWYKEKLSSIHYISAVTLLFSSTQNISSYYWNTVADDSIPFLVFIQHTKLVSKGNYGGNHVYYIGSYLSNNDKQLTMKDEELINYWFLGLKKMFPHFDRSCVREKQLFRFSNAQHVVDTSYVSRIPSYQTPLPNVFIANFSQIFPEDRGINYAVREGKRVSEYMINSLTEQKDTNDIKG